MATKNDQEPFIRITVDEAKQKLESGEAVMVDVREPDEYVEVHARGVRLVPVNTVINEVDQIRDFAGDKEVLFICKSGQRSALAAEFATAAGLDAFAQLDNA
ncbi:MAG: rhodanese-like domain-containing protein [Dehalococcoidia bacterium]|nr:rhodanese-like domain-containing protein [Dehalococcoidia bacterium]